MIIIIMRRKKDNNKYIRDNYKDIEKMQIHTEENQKEIKEHGTYAFPVNVSLEKIQNYEQDSFLWHWHPEIELTWVMEGRVEYHVNDQTYIFTEGDALFVNANTLHSGNRIGKKTCSYISVTFHPRFLYGYESSILQTKYVNFITDNDEWGSLYLPRTTKSGKAVAGDIQKIYELYLDPPEDYELQVHLLLTHAWIQLYEQFKALPAPARKPRPNFKRLREIIAYLEEHYAEEISLDDVAASAHICKSECCRFFKKHMHMTIFEFLMYLRIQNSLPLLKEGESVTKVADMVGFSSPAYFGQIFKRYMKCTPREWKLGTTL